MKQPWTMAQQRRYRALVARLRQVADFDDESRRAVIARVCGGATSTTEIDRDGMTRIITEMHSLCRDAGVRLRRRPASRWTQEQFIAHLQARLGWDETRLAGFIRRVTRGFKGSPLTLTTREKSALIAALKALLRDQYLHTARRERPERAAQKPSHFKFIPGALSVPAAAAPEH